jgi:hypothetical protein
MQIRIYESQSSPSANALPGTAPTPAFSINISLNFKASSNTPLLNLRLGISPEQARSVFGKDLKIKVKKKGQRTFFQNFIEKPAPNSLIGVRAIYLRFFDGRLYQIEIFYENRSNTQTLENFTADFSARTNLPAWKIENGKAEIICGEFSIVADRVLNPRIELTNEAIRAQVEEIRRKENKKK